MSNQNPRVVFIGTRRSPDTVSLAIDEERYEYETSPFHIEKFKFIYRKSPLKALAYIKKNSSSFKKVEGPLWWLSFSKRGFGSKGICMVRARSGQDALRKAQEMKIAPDHDSLEYFQIDPDGEDVQNFPVDKLITPADLKSKKYESVKTEGACPFHY